MLLISLSFIFFVRKFKVCREIWKSKALESRLLSTWLLIVFEIICCRQIMFLVSVHRIRLFLCENLSVVKWAIQLKFNTLFEANDFHYSQFRQISPRNVSTTTEKMNKSRISNPYVIRHLHICWRQKPWTHLSANKRQYFSLNFVFRLSNSLTHRKLSSLSAVWCIFI